MGQDPGHTWALIFQIIHLELNTLGEQKECTLLLRKFYKKALSGKGMQGATRVAWRTVTSGDIGDKRSQKAKYVLIPEDTEKGQVRAWPWKF